jgi:hypothetical protein
MNVVGCHDAEKEAELQVQIDSKSSDLQQVQAANKALMAVGDSINKQLVIALAANDSIAQVNLTVQRRLASTQSALDKERKQTDSLNVVVAEMEPSYCELPGVQQQLADERTARVAAEAERDAVKGVAAELTAMITDRITPWYMKWKHDATKRNWFEKLLGADKQKPPDVVEPVF